MANLLRKIYYLLLIMLITPLSIWSQQATGNFPFHQIEYYGSEQGLNGSEVYWATQDMHGFMWFITSVSLNRFDGYSFHSYSYNFDTHTLLQGGYWGLTEDPDGKLWIPSLYQGLYSFDPYHEKFVQYRHQESNPQSLSMDFTTSVIADNNGNIWIGTDSGLDKFDQRTGLFSHFIHNDNDSSTLTYEGINALVMGGQNDERPSDQLWVISYSPGIDCFNKKTGKLIRHYVFPYPKAAVNWAQANVLIVNGIKNNSIWIGSDHEGLYGFNILSKEFIHINIDHPCRSANHLRGFYPVMEDHTGNLWTHNDDNEIVYYDRSKNKFYFLPVKMNKIKFIDLCGMIFEDRCQKVWFCTNNGLISIDTKQKNITTCQPDEANESSITGNFVGAIKRIKQGPLLVSSGTTHSGTIQVYDKGANTFSRFRLTELGRDIDTYASLHIYQDSKDVVWFSGFSGVDSYNPVTKQSHSYEFHNDTIGLNTRGCVGVLEDRNGRYWTSNWPNGLYQFDPATGYTRIFNTNGGPNSISTNKIGEIFQDSRGIIYVCGWEGGFITFNPDTEKFFIYHHDPEDPLSVSNESCHAWIEAKNGLIWFGTYGGGISVFNPETKKFRAFTTKDGLVHNNISSITADKNGQYWVGTKGGISCFTPPDDPFAPGCTITFRNYDVDDGLPSNVMNLISAYCDTDGTMYFGTRDAGMFYFQPDDLKDSDFIPPVYITEFHLLNKPVNVNDSNSVLSTRIEHTKEITLNYRQDQVSFTFAALNLIHPEKNRYAYMLEGYDEDWTYTDASKRFATYTNLDPGDYTFKVKGSNNDGKWNEVPTELKISITPPFWQTVWFKFLVVFLIMGTAYQFYRYRIGQIVLLQNIRNKIAADLHDDIGSTLNSISVYSELASRDPAKRDHALTMIGESSRKIIDSMSDIVWTINPQNDNFDKIIFRMSSLTHNLLKAKRIDCTFKSDESLNEIKVPMDIRKNFYLIFKEALNNLVKYSNATRASVLVSYDNKLVTFIIRDNGVGFDPSNSYNGNGIVNMRRRAQEIKAQLNIDSAIGSGTSIELILQV